MITSALVVQGASQVIDSQSVSGLSADTQAGGGDFGEAFSQSLAAGGGSSDATSTSTATAKPSSEAAGTAGPERQSKAASGTASPDTNVKALSKPTLAARTGIAGKVNPGQASLQTELRSSRMASIEDALSSSATKTDTPDGAIKSAAGQPAGKTLIADADVPAAASDAGKAGAEGGIRLQVADLSDPSKLAGAHIRGSALNAAAETKSSLDVAEEEGTGDAKEKVEVHSSAKVTNVSLKSTGGADPATPSQTINLLANAYAGAPLIAIATGDEQRLRASVSGATTVQAARQPVDVKPGGGFQNGLQLSSSDHKSSVPAWTGGIALTGTNERSTDSVPSKLSAADLSAGGEDKRVEGKVSGSAQTLNTTYDSEVLQAHSLASANGQRTDAVTGKEDFHSVIASQPDGLATISSQTQAASSTLTGSVAPVAANPQPAVGQKASLPSTDASTTLALSEAKTRGSLVSPIQSGATSRNISERPSQENPSASVDGDAIGTPPRPQTLNTTGSASDQNLSSVPTAHAALTPALNGATLRPSQPAKPNGVRSQVSAAKADLSTKATEVEASSGSRGETFAAQQTLLHEGASRESNPAPVTADATVLAGSAATIGTQAVPLAISTSQHLAVGIASPSRGVDAGDLSALRTSSTESPVTTHGAQSLASSSAPQSVSATPTALEVGVHGGGTQGWLRIRAEMDGQGEVTASLAASSPRGEELLKGQMPALNAYLHSEQMSVLTTLAERGLPGSASSAHSASLPSLAAESSATGHNGSAFQGGSGQSLDGRSLDGQSQNEQRDFGRSVADAGDFSTGVRPLRDQAGIASGLPVTALDGSGRWLNVRA